MRIHHGFDHLPAIHRPAVAIGSFDGVHRGHRLLIEQLQSLSKQNKGESVVVTFEPHPRLVLHGENRLLTTLPEKLRLLSETPVKHVIVVPFTEEFSRIPGQQFINDFLLEKLGATVVLSGDRHHFGRDRSGNLEKIDQSGIETLRLERYDNISSTAVREAVEAGDMDRAADMLGGSYLILTEPYEPSKLLPPPGEYLVQTVSGLERMLIDPSIFEGPAREIRIVGK